jgi:hypothetical protein
MGKRTRTTWHPKAKLTEFAVRRIVEQLNKGFPHDVIADCYGVSRVAITNINTGLTWSHVTGRRSKALSL